MSLIEELKEELTACDEELRKCDEIIIKQQERRNCYAEKKTMLEKFINHAMLEQEKMNKTKPAEKRESSKRSKTKSNEENVSEDTSDTTDATDLKMSVKELAESLNVSQSAVANMTNSLGLELKMIDSKYMLTAEQIELVTKAMKAK